MLTQQESSVRERERGGGGEHALDKGINLNLEIAACFPER